MKTAYLIGNGIRTKDQLEYLKASKGPNSVIIAINKAIYEFPDWGFHPDIAGDLEMAHDHDFSREKILKHFYIDIIPDYPDIQFYFPLWLKEYLDEPIPSRFHFFPITGWIYKEPGKNPEGHILKFSDSGGAFSHLAIQYLQCDKLVLVGCTGFYTEQELHEHGMAHKHDKVTRQCRINWTRLAKWNFLNRKVPILNASIDTHIDCFPKISLGNEFQPFKENILFPQDRFMETE